MSTRTERTSGLYAHVLTTPSLKLLTEHDLMSKAEREETEWQLVKYRTLSRDSRLNGRRAYYMKKFKAVKHKLILNNLRYIIRMASKYKVPEDRWGDLISEAILGFGKALDKYDGSFRLTTYASWWIRQHIARGVLYDHVVRYPAYVYERSGVPFGNTESLDETYPNGHPVRDLEDEKPLAEELVNAEESREIVRRLVYELPKREREIIRLRFGFDREPETLDQVGKRFRLTRERIRQIEQKGLEMLKTRMKGGGIK